MRASSTKLHDAITAAIGTFGRPTPFQVGLLSRVEQDYYNDYFGVPDAPIAALVCDLNRAGLPGLAERAADGDFDGTADEAAEWRTSPEGREAFSELGL